MKKSHLLILLSIVFVGISSFVVWFSISEATKNQEIRGQAYGEGAGGGGGGNGQIDNSNCSEMPVNTQFRISSDKDTLWYAGNEIHPKVGDAIDVNCFAKNGAALMSNPTIAATLTPPGATNSDKPAASPITLSNPNTAEIRKFVLTAPGKLTFTCKNTSGTCTDIDSFVATGSALPSPSASPVCSTSPAGKADLNGDGKVDINDYASFVTYYRQATGL